MYEKMTQNYIYLPPFQSTLNSTVLNSSQLGDSPFYPGKTTYGGAAAVRSLRSRPGTPYQVSKMMVMYGVKTEAFIVTMAPSRSYALYFIYLFFIWLVHPCKT